MTTVTVDTFSLYVTSPFVISISPSQRTPPIAPVGCPKKYNLCVAPRPDWGQPTGQDVVPRSLALVERESCKRELSRTTASATTREKISVFFTRMSRFFLNVYISLHCLTMLENNSKQKIWSIRDGSNFKQ